jgi:hypothetical protein
MNIIIILLIITNLILIVLVLLLLSKLSLLFQIINKNNLIELLAGKIQDIHISSSQIMYFIKTLKNKTTSE